MSRIAHGLTPPYYAVIFTSQRSEVGAEAYDAMAARMIDLAAAQPGFLGVETTRDASGLGITVSYWVDLEAIKGWKGHASHQAAQQRGRESWYASYRLRIAWVESEYDDQRP